MNMEFYVMAKTYNTYGGHTTLSRIGDFLLRGAPEFGEALGEITVTLHFPHTGPPLKTLEQLLEQHNKYRATLPNITFRRAKRKVEINIASELLDGQNWEYSPRLSLPLFQQGAAEIVDSLSLLKKRLKSSDSFDLDGFLSHCRAAIEHIPNDEDDLQELAAELKAAEQARLNAMSAWERLGIDWEDYHPRARDILDDPFYWNCTDDFSPHGNDTGADLLEAYRDWLKKHKNGQPVQFLERLAKRWGYAGADMMEDEVLDEAAIALAFAELKLRGECNIDARLLALNSIERQRDQAEGDTGWPHREERLRTLDKIERKLQQSDVQRSMSNS